MMKVKINRNAAKELKKILAEEGAEGKMIRVYITEMHGNHAHYGIDLDTPKEHDEIVKTDKEIDILMDSREEYLDGIWIQFFYVGDNPGFTITNPSKDTDRNH